MDFRLLGPFDVAEHGHSLALGRPKQRSLLAVLLLHANQVVSTDRLIDDLWGEAPPATAAKSVHVYVSGLRRALAANGAGDTTEDRLLTHGRGYMIRVEAGELDLQVFEDSLAEAREALAAGLPAKAAEVLRGAGALWRGPALADFTYEPFAQPEIARLEELRMSALEERIEADLELGRHGELVGELEALVGEHPLRERFWRQLMTALYRSGRQGDALEAYQRARHELVEELGLEPSQELKLLQEAILRHDPAIAAPPRPPTPPRPAAGHGAASTASRESRWAVTASRLFPYRYVLIAAGALALAGAVAVGAVELMGRDARTPAPAVESGTPRGLTALDLATGALRESVELPGAPGRVAVGADAIWAAIDETRTLVAIDPQDGSILRTTPAVGFPSDIAVTKDAVWVADGTRGVLTAVHPGYGSIVRRTRFRAAGAPHRSHKHRAALEPTSIARRRRRRLGHGRIASAPAGGPGLGRGRAVVSLAPAARRRGGWRGRGLGGQRRFARGSRG
jgi:DNA-binding SARP family transcriptional activator